MIQREQANRNETPVALEFRYGKGPDVTEKVGSSSSNELEDSMNSEASEMKKKKIRDERPVIILIPCPELAQCVLPMNHLVVAKGSLAGDENAMEDSLEALASEANIEDGDLAVNEVLDGLERQIQEDILRYIEQVGEGVDPDTADRLRETDVEMTRRAGIIASTRSKVAHERDTQEGLMRDFRSRVERASAQSSQVASERNPRGRSSHGHLSHRTDSYRQPRNR
eukprot:CAMPEP_0185770678 /NCGR_PEP_ID=MMETSP1174-20130828/60472_1 /TAXON_ID=35687 /ORGANISM="Dictyocha speculum, Strain CCMP1381" /LENGTH=224 /DNA_ID=CAMNT_0028456215 /DNA_START=24 /DNA_END=698 /DNA_ORIENTATION=+